MNGLSVIEHLECLFGRSKTLSIGIFSYFYYICDLQMQFFDRSAVPVLYMTP